MQTTHQNKPTTIALQPCRKHHDSHGKHTFTASTRQVSKLAKKSKNDNPYTDTQATHMEQNKNKHRLASRSGKQILYCALRGEGWPRGWALHKYDRVRKGWAYPLLDSHRYGNCIRGMLSIMFPSRCDLRLIFLVICSMSPGLQPCAPTSVHAQPRNPFGYFHELHDQPCAPPALGVEETIHGE